MTTALLGLLLLLSIPLLTFSYVKAVTHLRESGRQALKEKYKWKVVVWSGNCFVIRKRDPRYKHLQEYIYVTKERQPLHYTSEKLKFPFDATDPESRADALVKAQEYADGLNDVEERVA